MSERVLAERYAKALLDLGIEEKSLDRFREELERFSQAIDLESNLLTILSSKDIDRKKRESILKDLMLKLLLSPLVQNFLKLLFKKGRMVLLPEIAVAFEELVRKIDEVVVAKVKVAHKESVLPMKDHLKEALEKMTGKKVDCQFEEDTSLIGGMQISLGDKIYDASILGELKRIQEQWI